MSGPGEGIEGIGAILDGAARSGATLTYLQVAERAGLAGPGRIARVAAALERTILEDHAAGRPLRAAVAVSRVRDGLPAPGFFQLCREIGRYSGPDRGPEAAAFHAGELRAARAAARGPESP